MHPSVNHVTLKPVTTTSLGGLTAPALPLVVAQIDLCP